MPRIDSIVVLNKDDIAQLRKGRELYVEFGDIRFPIIYERAKWGTKKTPTGETIENLKCIVDGCPTLSKNTIGLKYHLLRSHKRDQKAKQWLEDQRKGEV
jgi:hypothetical protein